MVLMASLDVDERIKVKGGVEVYQYDAKVVPTYQAYLRARRLGIPPEKLVVVDNIMVTVGLQQIIDLVTGASTTVWTYCGVGSGTNAPVVGDTALQTEISPRKPITAKYRSGTVAKFDTFFDTPDNNGTWNEAGLFTASSGGILGSRALFSPAVTKASTNTQTVNWTWTAA